jgi:hypothetical protein
MKASKMMMIKLVSILARKVKTALKLNSSLSSRLKRMNMRVLMRIKVCAILKSLDL